MSAKPEIPPEDAINVEINGETYPARKGQMIIEITDEHGITVPRFCYHKKLPIAANCRMCLVQVEKAPKPLPACATPVADGMKIWTDSDYAREAQKSVMEFLLINHPLDCPICDQGGECELQDVALGYGRSVSRFTEKKRVVKDEDLGSLIATDMTRCIHCTRCVRFLDVIGGFKELGGVGRGENMAIRAYVGQGVSSEMSGNVIDVCPVGALTSKPFRFRARAWELTQHASVAPHDCVGSNLYLHARRGDVLRVVPRENEEINEVWLSDRDRFGYAGLNSPERLERPMIRRDGDWQETDWETALQAVADMLRVYSGERAAQLGVLVSPTATVEEMYLLNRLSEQLECSNIDHRLRQSDFSDQDRLPLFPWLGQRIEELEQQQAVLLVGSNIRKEQPILGHRLRKACLNGAGIMAINPVDYDFNFDLVEKLIHAPHAMVDDLAGVAAALLTLKQEAAPSELHGVIAQASPAEVHQRIAERLSEVRPATVMLGSTAAAHPSANALRALAGFICELSGATLSLLSDGGNGAGGWLAGVLPHRGPAGSDRDSTGLDARGMLETPRSAYVLYGCEPEFDFADAQQARGAFAQAETVVAFTAYVSDSLRECARVLLPISPYSETSGTYVNVEGRWQSFAGAVAPRGQARPGWKVVRVLGNLLGLKDFDYMSSEEVRDELRSQAADRRPRNERVPGEMVLAPAPDGLQRIGDVPIYAVDGIVRRAPALQAATDGGDAQLRLNPAQAARLNLGSATQVRVEQGEAQAVLQLVLDEQVPEGAAWIPAGCPATRELGANFGGVKLNWV
ncbi:NADH-quinone oxidoreductase subunit G [Thiohalobacter thiocyanaticus]|uniref:NADH-quinone oxidoreductase n=1 Tax=Thiohalobacter thiocyanaticus TaxID=585455 RepID=A0A1Z4VR41_9GAMM|nr:NADH-quinone oxidoreductase subunit NuoG [Thiohalobacter thiocyanaticus]BAZ94101.1 NADH-quinone oxidoreductase subunit G [Thiohalobacter thiocyanaticus]